MQLLGSLLLSSCLINIALAAPVLEHQQQKRQPGSFKVERVRNPHYQPDGPAELKRAYKRYGVDVPAELERRLAARAAIDASNGTGSVSNTPVFRDKEFLSPVTIGGQGFLLNFDTGSSDLWVFSTHQPAEQTQGHTVFDPTKSNTFRSLPGQSFAVRYGDGSFAKGVVGTDRVDIGGATVDSQAVELAVNVSDAFIQDTASQGLVGLAFSQLNRVRPTKQTTFFESVLPSLSAPVLTASLKSGTPGTYEFGNIDPTSFSGNLTFTDVTASGGFWSFSPTKFTIAGQDLDLAGIPAIADTGTTLMLIDPAIAQAYYQTISGAALDPALGFVFPCSQTAPDLSIEIAGKTLTVPGGLINIGPADPSTDNSTCFGGIQAIPNPPMIFGDVFLKSVFVVFDAGNPPQLGFAEHALNAPNATAPLGSD